MTTEVFEVPFAERDAEITQYFHASEPRVSEGMPFIINWSPGNGTCYRVMFSPLDPEVSKATGFSFGYEGQTYLVTWIIPGDQCQSYVFVADGGFLSHGYVHEKLCFKVGSRIDASELTRIIGAILNREPGLCTDEHGREKFD